MSSDHSTDLLESLNRWKSYCESREDPTHEELHSFCIVPEEQSSLRRLVAQVDNYWETLGKNLNDDTVLARIKLMKGT